jgi:hypothetical protein
MKDAKCTWSMEQVHLNPAFIVTVVLFVATLEAMAQEQECSNAI